MQYFRYFIIYLILYIVNLVYCILVYGILMNKELHSLCRYIVIKNKMTLSLKTSMSIVCITIFILLLKILQFLLFYQKTKSKF